MISRDNYFEPHIRDLQAASKGDPGLIERTLYAFGLLEALTSVGMDFIFKGGTSLLLLLPNPKRLSTDIDIVVNPDTDVDDYIKKASRIFPFTAMEEQKREGKNNIVKRHFKFTYDLRRSNSNNLSKPLSALQGKRIRRSIYSTAQRGHITYGRLSCSLW